MLSPSAVKLLIELEKNGNAPARSRKAVRELIESGFAAKAARGLVIRPAGQFAAQSLMLSQTEKEPK